MSREWKQYIGDRVIEAPFGIKDHVVDDIMFFESGRVLVLQDYGWNGYDIEMYESVEEFKKNYIDAIMLSIILDAPVYKNQKEDN